MRLTSALAVLTVIFFGQAARATEPPGNIRQCVQRAAVELTSKAGQMSSAETSRLFRKYAAPKDQLGAYLYGPRTWPTFSKAKQDYGIRIFYSAFHRRMMTEESPVDSRSAKVVSQRLADHGAIKKHWYGAKTPVLVYQVIVKIEDDVGNTDVGVVFVSPNCKFFDLMHGGAALSMAVSARKVEEYKG